MIDVPVDGHPRAGRVVPKESLSKKLRPPQGDRHPTRWRGPPQEGASGSGAAQLLGKVIEASRKIHLDTRGRTLR